jgi:dTDP-4-dehydrorhamnose 3,5-epimerase
MGLANVSPREGRRDVPISENRIERLAVSGACTIRPQRFGDERGWFSRLVDTREFLPERPTFDIVNINNSYSLHRGTLRGLHWQTGEAAEAKLVRCIRGSVLDVVVDVRDGSPTFGRAVSAILESTSGLQLYVPNGCAHGVLTLVDDSEIIYAVDRAYTPSAERGMRWNDSSVRIDWPIVPAYVSDKDRAWPSFIA